MTLIRVEGDETEEYELISDHEFKRYTYFHEQDCQTPSSSMLGKYCKITTYYLDFDIKRLSEALYGSNEPNLVLPSVMNDFNPRIQSADVEVNEGYDPETYQKIFEEKSKFADKMEREYGMRIY